MIDGIILLSLYIAGTVILLVAATVISDAWDMLKVLARRHKIIGRMR